MNTSLTKKQKNILDYIQDFIDENEYSPSYREIAKNFKLSSVSTIHQHVQALQSKGYLSSDGNENSSSARSLEPTKTPRPSKSGIVNIPLVGLITAGQPIEALVENDQISIPETLVKKGHYYSLKVKGDSMIDDGIFDGDFVIIEEKDTADNGEIVVALLENQFATLKRYYREKDHIRLQPANSSMEPFRVKNVKVQGKVVGLLRSYL